MADSLNPMFPFPTVSSYFDQAVDFPENLEDPRALVEVVGDETDAIVEPTVDEPVCEACGEPNPARTKDEHGTLMCESCLDDSFFEPCCRGVTQRLGLMGDHEWGCPNY